MERKGTKLTSPSGWRAGEILRTLHEDETRYQNAGRGSAREATSTPAEQSQKVAAKPPNGTAGGTGAGSTARPDRLKFGGISWAIWAERAVVRALEIHPETRVEGGLLHGQRAAHVTLLIARAIGYLTGSQRAPDLPANVRGWLDSVAPSGVAPRGPRLGGLSWGEWAERASVLAIEIDTHDELKDGLLAGQPLWEVAATIARAVGYLGGATRAPKLPVQIVAWLQGTQPSDRAFSNGAARHNGSAVQNGSPAMTSEEGRT